MKNCKAIEKAAKAEEKKDGNKRLAATAACVAAAAIAGINLAKKGKLGKAAQEFMGGAANNAKLGNQVGQQIADEAAQAAQKGANEVAQAAGKAVPKGIGEEAAEVVQKKAEKAGHALTEAYEDLNKAERNLADLELRKTRGLGGVTDDDILAAKAARDAKKADFDRVNKEFDIIDGTDAERRIAALQKEQQEMQQKLDRETRLHDQANARGRERLEENKRLTQTNERLVADNSKANKRIGELQAENDALRNSPPVTSSAAKFTTGNGMSIEIDPNKSIDENLANIQKFVKKNKRFYQSAKKQMSPIREYVFEQIDKHPIGSPNGNFYRQLYGRML